MSDSELKIRPMDERSAKAYALDFARTRTRQARRRFNTLANAVQFLGGGDLSDAQAAEWIRHEMQRVNGWTVPPFTYKAQTPSTIEAAAEARNAKFRKKTKRLKRDGLTSSLNRAKAIVRNHIKAPRPAAD